MAKTKSSGASRGASKTATAKAKSGSTGAAKSGAGRNAPAAKKPAKTSGTHAKAAIAAKVKKVEKTATPAGKAAKPVAKPAKAKAAPLAKAAKSAAVPRPRAVSMRRDEERADEPVRLVQTTQEARAPRATPMPEGPVRGKYVYCIIQSAEPVNFGQIGIGAEPAEVFTVHYRDLAAVVSDTALVVHDPTRENVLAHQGVAETVMRSYTVIPMSFGTVFKTREDIIELLRSAYDAFGDVLNKMQNKFEFGLKVLWDRDQIVHEIEREDENVRRLKDEIAGQKGSTYFARMQYGRLVDATLQSRSEQYVGEIFHALRDVAVASRTNKPIGDKMILNAAFLVSRDAEAGFDARVKEIGQRYEGRLTFKYTGPWPPYNFVNIRLKLERAQ